MKKLVIISVFALSGLFPVTGVLLNAQDSNAEALTKKVSELEGALAASDKAMLEMLEKNMGIISKLRTENRELRARIAALEGQASAPVEKAVPARRSIYDSTKDNMKSARHENTELSIDANAPFDSMKSDKDSVYSKADKERIRKDREAIDAKKDSRTDKKSDSEEKSGDSIWDSIFPF